MRRWWRLGIDLGTNSLGWAALELARPAREGDDPGPPIGVIATGVRIFSDGRDPKSKQSLAVERREARAMRRRRDRLKQRQAALLRHLERDGLFPRDATERARLERMDPYALRTRALDERLDPGEIGRALIHLNQRRGFKSNRKADRGADEEAGKIRVGVGKLYEKMHDAGARTLGEFLHRRRAAAGDGHAVPSVRARLRGDPDGKGTGYDFYPDRQMVDDEFDAIWTAQAAHHPALLTPDARARFHEIIFHQRPLKQPEIGRCTLVPDEGRLAKAHPLFQRRRLLEELNHLAVVRPGEKAERLTREQRDLLFLKLKDQRKATFAALRRTLKLDPAARFNKESEHRTDLLGDEVTAEMAAAKRFGTRWAHLSVDAQWDVIERLRRVESEADDAAFRAWLADTHHVSAEQAAAISGARLPEGYGRFGPTATAKLVAALTDGTTADGRVLVYSEAAALAGYHHSDFRTGEVHQDDAGRPALPYYARALERHVMPGSADPDEADDARRYGRLTNPTVHIGLNQLRRVVNALIRRFGPPHEIAVELARELKLSEEEKKRRNAENTRNRQAAEGRSDKLREIGQRDGGANRALLKLWEELNPGNVLDRRCVYTGEQISIDMLFRGEAEVDHILPFAQTLDDSNANKIVCLRSANREKARRSPYEAWGHTDRWPEIAERAARLPKAKRWRFEPDALTRFDEDGGFLARQLVDTQHLARLASDYLRTLYPETGEKSSHVWVSPGRLTELVRRKLGLNSLLPDHNFGGGADQPKNRLDHRHHAIDAAVVAILDRGMLNRIARAAGQGADDAELRILIPDPWDGFRDALKRALDTTVVAHRPDHGTVSAGRRRAGGDQTAGRLHNDTAYGLTGETDAKGNALVVRRVGVAALRKPADLDGIRDPVLRAALGDFTEGLDGKAFEARMAQLPTHGPLPYRTMRRVRKIEPLAVIPIRDADGRAYKGYKGDSNYRYDVWEMPDGKWITHWRDRQGIDRCSIVSMFDAHQSADQPRPHPAAKRVLSLHRDDLVAIGPPDGERTLRRIVKFGQNGQITLAAAHESGDLKRRDASADDPFKYVAPTAGGLKKLQARQVRVDELGRVLDPGFPARKRVRRTRPRAAAE